MKPPAASDGMVVYDGVSKFFPVRARPGREDSAELMVALDRINATVRKGELITLLGPSGCGKTTLLRLTAGLIVADEGRITIAGTPVSRAVPARAQCRSGSLDISWSTFAGDAACAHREARRVRRDYRLSSVNWTKSV